MHHHVLVREDALDLPHARRRRRRGGLGAFRAAGPPSEHLQPAAIRLPLPFRHDHIARE